MQNNLNTLPWSEIEAIGKFAFTYDDLRLLFERAIKEKGLLYHSGYWLQSAVLSARKQEALEYIIDLVRCTRNPVSKNNTKITIDSLLKMAENLPEGDMSTIQIAQSWTYDPITQIIKYSNTSLYGLGYGGKEYVWKKKSIKDNKPVVITLRRRENSYPSRD